ncbi:beta strand repeat-containing protein, partial [Flavobacterium hauense]
MQNTYFPARKIALLNLFILFLIGFCGHAQVYYHNFGTTAISTHPYNVAPPVMDSHLSGSSWTNSSGTWASNPGSAASTAITLPAAPGTNTINLTFTVANSYQLEITSFDFWRQKSSIGPANWALSINGINVGNGAVPTTGAPIGVTNVSTPITGLTGTVTVTLTVTGGTGGNMRLDDFTLNGTVTSNCTAAVISSFLPASGPANTIVTITGTGFTNATAVKFNNVNASAFSIISDTTIKATVPATATPGAIIITANGCDGSSTGSFNKLTPSCTNNFTEIFISEIYDQKGGAGGMIELYNPTAAAINLNGYTLYRFVDNAATPLSNDIINLTGVINAGATYLIACSEPNAALCAAPSSAATVGSGFNQDDKFELLKNGVVIDRVISPPSSPGFTVIRKPNAIAPTPTYNSSEWNITMHPGPTGTNATPNNLCQDLGSHTITPTPVPTITHPVSATVCENGTTTFTVTLNPSAGFTYQWKVLNSAGVWVNVTNNANYSGATTNSLVISQIPLSFDSNQYYCQITSTACTLMSNAVQLTVIAAPAIATATTIQPTCTTATGTITVTAPTATGLTYSINGTTFQAGLVFNNVAPGSYTITVKNSNNCISTSAPIVINPASGAPAVASVTVTQPTCTTITGTIVVDAPLGAGLTYSIDATTFGTGTTFANLNPGSYTITVKDAGGCTSATSPIVINTPPAGPAVADVTVLQPTCTTPTGTITINTPTGAGITYSINGTTFVTGTVFANLNPGTYNITVRDAGGCTSTTPAITISPAPSAPAIANVTVTQPTCTAATGTITVNTPTGTGITYSLDGTTFVTGATFTNLLPGTYTITVRNAAGCTSVTPTIIINAAPTVPAVASVTITQPTCTTPTGTITVDTPAGAGIIYSIDGTTFITGNIFANLLPGTYTITVRNSDGCTSVTPTITINAAPAIPSVANVTVTQPTCTVLTGTIIVNTPVGAGITYSIDGTTFVTGTVFANLLPGTYTITVRNAAGCTSVTPTITINTPPSSPAIADVTVTQPTCAVQTGSIMVNTPVGGGITYSLNGTTFQTGTVFNGLTAGTYHVTVKNAAGCTSVTADIIINPAPPVPAVANTTLVQPTCTTPTGTMTINSPTATDITYSIDGTNFQPGTTFSNLAPGVYTVTVLNGAGCSSQINRTINPVPVPPAVADVTVEQPECTSTTGTITVNSPVGTGLSYSINGIDFQTSSVFNNVAPGTYNVTVKNTGDCISTSASITVNNSPGGLPPIPQPAPIAKCDLNNDGFEFFDLDNTIQAIQTALGNVTVTVHETPEDAEHNVNKIPNTNQYANVIPHSQQLYIRVDSNTTDCYDIVVLQLIANPVPEATTPEDYELCDDGVSDTDGYA